MKGYFTVEATLIFPIVFFIYVFLLYIGFYQYDRCMMEQDIRRIALRGSAMTYVESKEVLSSVQKMLNNNDWNKYIIIEERDVETTVVWETVNIKVNSYLQIPFLNRIWAGIEKRWTFTVSGESETIDGAMFLRMSNKLLGGIKDAGNGTDSGAEP